MLRLADQAQLHAKGDKMCRDAHLPRGRNITRRLLEERRLENDDEKAETARTGVAGASSGVVTAFGGQNTPR